MESRVPSPQTDVRMRGFRNRADVLDVLELIRHRIHPLSAEMVGLSEADGRVLAEDVIAGVAVPHFDRAAMDGYAVLGEETFGAGPYNPLELRLIGEAWPGRAFEGRVGRGQAVRIMTGAPLPEGADAVLMAEATELVGDRVRITESVPPGRHVGQRGEDIPAGTVVLQAGRVLRPQDVGVLASIGVVQAPVVRRPHVALVMTGDELASPGCPRTPYQIVDSNSLMLAALVRRDGGLPACGPIVPDRRELVRRALLEASGDLVLVSGGSSVGVEDHAPTLVAEEGELLVHGVALRPASPVGIGVLPRGLGPDLAGGAGDGVRSEGGPISGRDTRRLVFLLPGNPVSCLGAYDFFAGPAIRLLGGRSMDWPYRTIDLPLGRKITSAIGRVDYVRVRVESGQVIPLAISGASILSSTTRADGVVIVPRDSEGCAAGDPVTVFLYDLP